VLGVRLHGRGEVREVRGVLALVREQEQLQRLQHPGRRANVDHPGVAARVETESKI